MKNRHAHKQDRNRRKFEAHKMDRGSDEVRLGRPWRFNKEEISYFEPHFRVTARIAALPGKHMRPAEETVRSSHGK